VFEDQSEECTFCPPNSDLKLGVTQGTIETVCLCRENYYREIANGGMSCVRCPTRSISAAGSTDRQDCTREEEDLFVDKITGEFLKCPVNSVLQDGVTSGLPENVCSCSENFYREITNGVMTCSRPDWITANKCDDSQFLNDTSLDKYEWKCLACPDGGSCKGEIKNNDITALFGWSRCPSTKIGNTSWFEKCAFGGSCLGKKNELLVGKFKESDNNTETDPALINHHESCSSPYHNQSLLCAGCATDFSRSGLDAQCKKCPEPGINILIGVLGSIAAAIGLVIFLYVSLQDKGEVQPKDGARSIGTSFVQTMSLLITFHIQWPQVFKTLFNIGGAVTILGQHLVNLKCAYPALSEADVFFSQRIVWSILPFILSSLCILTWYLLSKCRNVDDWWANAKSSVVALLFFIWPGLCAETFAMFACKSVCGEMVMVVDLNERCWEGRHSGFAVLGVAMVILYVVGMPLVGMINIWRMQQRSAEQKCNIHTLKGYLTWGVFLSAYDESVWWWEGTVAIRKITIAAFGAFGSGMGTMQIHALLILNVVVLLVTAAVRPFGKHKLLHFLEMCTLMVLWVVLWAGSVFNDYPLCENEKGVILGWCDFLSWVVSILVIATLLLCVGSMVYYAKHEMFEECWNRYVVQRLRRRRERIQNRRNNRRRSRMNEGKVSVNPLEQQPREFELSEIVESVDFESGGGDVNGGGM